MGGPDAAAIGPFEPVSDWRSYAVSRRYEVTDPRFDIYGNTSQLDEPGREDGL